MRERRVLEPNLMPIHRVVIFSKASIRFARACGTTSEWNNFKSVPIRQDDSGRAQRIRYEGIKGRSEGEGQESGGAEEAKRLLNSREVKNGPTKPLPVFRWAKCACSL